MFDIDKEKDIVQYSTVHVQYSTVADGKILKRDAIHIVHGQSSVTLSTSTSFPLLVHECVG
jgi:hypothetical protein